MTNQSPLSPSMRGQFERMITLLERADRYFLYGFGHIVHVHITDDDRNNFIAALRTALTPAQRTEK